MQLCIIFQILLIVPIFAFAAPVLVQEKCQECTDMSAMTADIPEYSITLLGKRGSIYGEIEEEGSQFIENWFVPPEKSSVEHVPSGSAPPEPGHVSMSDANAPAPSEPGHASTGSVNAPAPNPGPSTGSDQWLTGMGEPMSSPVHPTWFDPNINLLGPNMEPYPSIELGSGHKLVEEPPSIPGSPTTLEVDQSGHKTVESNPGSSINPGRRSMDTDSRLENAQVVSDALKGSLKESRRVSGTARDLW